MGHITMSKRELEQAKVFDKLKNEEITQKEAAARLGFSTRWVRKKFMRYKQFGDKGLLHMNRGRLSKKRWNKQEYSLTIELLTSKWHSFGPTFTTEKLKELYGIKISKETVRQAMIAERIHHPKQRRLKHRKRRERRPMIGMLVQLEGSPHDWFEGRGERCTLLVFIDDATSKLLWLEFAKSESNIDVMQATKNYVKRYGRPHAFYVDFGGVFRVNLNNAEHIKKTQWECALEELEIEVKHAHSPQAKGRVERANGTLQDRLIKEMRLAGVSSIDAANTFIRESNFIEKHNNCFSITPAQSGNAHRLIDFYDLDKIFCLREKRLLANDYTIMYNKSIFQLEARQRTIIRPGNTITVNTHLNGSITLSIRKTELDYKELNVKHTKPIKENLLAKKPYKPSENSKRWVAGLAPLYQKLNPQGSRVKRPAGEAS